jgi:predicted RNA-binding protein YlqC (UPF0109 family)
MNMSEILQDFVDSTIKKIVDTPEDVKITTTVSTKSVIIQIKSNQEDLGKIIGKKGRTIESLKVLTLAIKNTQFPRDTRRVVLEIIEDEDSSFLDLP